MELHLFERLHREGHLSDASLQNVKTAEKHRLFSLHWELKTLLYLGVLLLSGGLGTLIYKNIDTIGHLAIIFLIAVISAGCFFYCFRQKRPFSWHKVLSPNVFFDYILLLGCLTMITFITYLQAQYTVFGYGYSASTFIPMVILFFAAYYFDHLGVLSLAITTLGSWMGIALTPLDILNANNFGDQQLIFTGIILGALLLALSYLSRERDLKQHFSFTYANFGVHIMFIALIAAELYFENMLWFLPLVALTVFFLLQARKERSFYFVLITILYSYVALTITILMSIGRYMDWDVLAILFYFLFSGIGCIAWLMGEHKRLKLHDRI
ncbi:DUF2157 domain-containing protein [Chitinophaga horti]|uniref:DUF2157 domain-containing protein n=1 Tax=Chitinophaga horti TaxID=2920382 RepID=A0ABY6J5R9_9BACT|nr:DUF2157 domain-containing protein [Chitinophaga horti]UYQ95028.1 DUF2157 domain-containing protein [Chitinophaga horti]